jgi:DNA-binding MarR family transcriptional regulator
MRLKKLPSTDQIERPSLDLNNYVPALLIWLTNKLSSDASRSYRAWYGLGVTEWRVLAYLGVYEDGTAAKICKLIGLDKAATSRSIVTLKERRLIRTKQLKGREVELTITESGREKYENILTVALPREEALLNGLSQVERKALIFMLHTMLGNLDAVAAVEPAATSQKGLHSPPISTPVPRTRRTRSRENRTI